MKERRLWLSLVTGGLILSTIACGLKVRPEPEETTPQAAGATPTSKLLLPQSAAGTTSMDLLDSIAADLYDAVLSGGDVQGQMAEIFKVFGAQVLSAEEDEAEFQRLIEAGEPVVLNVQLEAMAQGFEKNMMVTLDSFIADAAERGVTAADPPGPLTRQYLTEKLAYLADKKELEPAEVLPALVFALGRERASRCEARITDPVWGDDVLDPLQFALISYDIAYSASSEPTAMLVLVRWPAVAPEIPGMLGNSVLAGSVGIGEAADGAAHDIICESLTLYSYFMQVTAAPDHLYLRQSAKDRPSESQVTASLVFERPPGWPDIVIEFCGLPKSGPVSQMDIEWKLAGQLPEYGELVKDKKGTETDRDGVARAVYQVTKEETVPRPLQMGPSEIVDGTVEAKASGTLLTSSSWARRLIVEPVIYKRLFRPKSEPWLDKTTISVELYSPPALELEFDHQFRVIDPTKPDEVHAAFKVTGLVPVSWRRQGEEAILEGEGTVAIEVQDVRIVWIFFQQENSPAYWCWSVEPAEGTVAVTVEGKAIQTEAGTAELHLKLDEHRYETWGGGTLMCENGESIPWDAPPEQVAFDLVFPVKDGHTVSVDAPGAPYISGFLSWTLHIQRPAW